MLVDDQVEDLKERFVRHVRATGNTAGNERDVSLTIVTRDGKEDGAFR